MSHHQLHVTPTPRYDMMALDQEAAKMVEPSHRILKCQAFLGDDMAVFKIR